MLEHQIISIMAALESGDKTQARHLLRPILQSDPTADAWWLAAQACENSQHEQMCLQKALALDPYHAKAKSRLFALRQNQQPPTPPPPAAPRPVVASAETAALKPRPASDLPDVRTLKKVRRQRRNPLSRPGCLMFVVLSLFSSYFVLSFLGTGLAGEIAGFLTGSAPVRDIDGVPVEQIPDAVYRVEPDTAKMLQDEAQQVDILQAGYTHAYTFNARSGREVAIYVQFMSPTAQSVNRNVAVFDPDGHDAESHCQRDRILADNTGVTFICQIHQPGIWEVRIFGREGESSGAYFVSVADM